MLVSLLNYQSAEKSGGKRDLFVLIGLSSFEIVFMLLAKVIAVNILVSIIQFVKPSFEGTLAMCGVCLKLAMLLTSNK